MSKKYILKFRPGAVEEPVTYCLIKEYDIRVNILRAEIYPGKSGIMLVELDADSIKLKQAISFLQYKDIEVIPFDKRIHLEIEKCVHCGACTAVCCTSALSILNEKSELVFTPDKCVACGLCVKACPLQLFQLQFEE